MEVIREHFLREGLGDIRVRYLGDDAVLSASEEEHMKDLIDGNKECLA